MENKQTNHGKIKIVAGIFAIALVAALLYWLFTSLLNVNQHSQRKKDPDHVAASQIDDENSVLNYYRKLTALRKNEAYKDTIVYGEVVPYLENEHNLMAFYREGEKQTLLVLGNFEKEEKILEEKEKASEISENIEEIKVIKPKRIGISEINKDRVWEIRNSEDIKEYLDKLRKRLEEELEDSGIVQVEF